MDRHKVRAEFERRFTAERMAGAYLAAYRLLLAHSDRSASLMALSAAPPAAPELMPEAWQDATGQAGSTIDALVAEQ